MTSELLDLLRCPACRSRMLVEPHGPGTATERLRCTGCDRQFAIENGIARFVSIPQDEAARRTQASFGYEWTHFNDWSQSGATNFNDYFEGVDVSSLGRSVVLDAGCGMGRHARQIAPFAGRVVAVDFSRAIDQAARNTRALGNVECVQADLQALPLPDGVFDFVYSLGVLHHLEDTAGALRRLVDKLKPGGKLRIYLYWKRHGWQGRVLSLVTLARQVTTRLPFPLLRLLCAVLSVGLYGLVIVPYRLLTSLGIRGHESWPLFVYSKYPFNVLYNDQFDRFSAPIEKRYDPTEVEALLRSVGLEQVQVRPCFGWLADGIKPA